MAKTSSAQKRIEEMDAYDQVLIIRIHFLYDHQDTQVHGASDDSDSLGVSNDFESECSSTAGPNL